MRRVPPEACRRFCFAHASLRVTKEAASIPRRESIMSSGGFDPRDFGLGGRRVPPQLSQLKLPKLHGKGSRILVGVVLLVLLFVGGYYQVEPDEVGVIQRFGAYVRTTDPGPHLKIPLVEMVLTMFPVMDSRSFSVPTGLAVTWTYGCPSEKRSILPGKNQ